MPSVMDIRNWFCFVCVPVCSLFTVGAILIIGGLVGLAVSNYTEDHSATGYQNKSTREISFILLITGAAFLVIMVCVTVCSKVRKTPRRRVCRASEQWRSAMLRLIEEANATQPRPTLPLFLSPPPPPPSDVRSTSETPPPCYMDTAPPPYEVVVGQVAGVHRTYKQEQASLGKTSNDG